MACAAAAVVVLGATLVGGDAGADTPAVSSIERRVFVESVSRATLGRGGPTAVVTAILRNPGASAATGVRVRYDAPPDTLIVAAELPNGCATGPTATTAECVVGTIAAGSSATVRVPLRVPDAGASPGTRLGSFSTPRTAGWDPLAGEVLVRSWNLEAGVQGESLQRCWPVQNPAPNMDIAGPVGSPCDGAVDTAATPPDEETIHDGHPPAFAESVTRSWEWRATYTPTVSGTHLVCGVLIDDGGYVAVAPDGETLDGSDVVLDIAGYSSGSAAVTLTAGTRYQILVRISNRGPAGVNNGGAHPGGWTAVGISAGSTCDASDTAAFGISAPGVAGTDSVVDVVGTADVRIIGALSGRVAGSPNLITAAVVENDGPDEATPVVTLDAGAGGRVAPTGDGCLIAPGGRSARCSVGRLGVEDRARVTQRVATTGTHRWGTEWAGGIDPDQDNDEVVFGRSG